MLYGRGREILRASTREWEEGLAASPEEMREVLTFMSDDHHHVRNFVVEQMVRTATALSAQTISQALDLPESRVGTILEELERHLFFLVRDADGLVTWAFPVTVDRTPHHLSFSSGERLWAA